MRLSPGITLRMRRYGLCAAATAFLLQVIAWAWMAPIASVAEDGGSTSIVICSIDGYKTIQLDDGQAPATDTDNAASSHGCPLCPLVAGLGLAAPVAVIGPRVVLRHGPEALPGAAIAAGWFLSTLQARAPPPIV